MLKNRNFWLVALVLSVLFGVYTALLSNLVPFAVDLGISKDRGALLISVIALFGMLGKLIFGVIADNIDLRAGLAAAAALVAIGLLLYLQGSYTMLLGGSVAIGLAAGGMLPVWGALLAKLFGSDNYGRVMGLMNPFIMPMTVIGSPLAGHIQDVTGSYRIAFIVFIAALLVAICMLPAIRMRQAAGAELSSATSAK
ncbi:MAG: MFS transporter [Halioglobus sp.]|nr:MFS transporter [Halioglobus sp.]